MSNAFEYRPKFVDIRVKKPAPETAKVREDQSARACDYAGCSGKGAHRAPKGREHEGQFWFFCYEHVTEYNRRWNYFEGMSDDEWSSYLAREEVGHRPTWTFRGSRGDRIAAARNFQAGRSSDPFSLFGAGAAEPKPAAARRRLTRLQAKALEELALGENATAAEIRARYAEQVKRWHPDSNGGDRGAEAQLQRVLRAYQTLKAGGLV